MAGPLVADVVIDPLHRSVTCPGTKFVPQNLLKASIPTDLRESHYIP